MKALFARFHRWVGEVFELDDVHYRLDPRVRVLEAKLEQYAALVHICHAELRLALQETKP